MKKNLLDAARILSGGVDFSKMSAKQLVNYCGFCLSFSLFLIVGCSLLLFPAIIGVIYFSEQIKDIHVDE